MGSVQDHFVGVSIWDQPQIITLVSVCGISLGSFPFAKSVGSVWDHCVRKYLGPCTWDQSAIISLNSVGSVWDHFLGLNTWDQSGNISLNL